MNSLELITKTFNTNVKPYIKEINVFYLKVMFDSKFHNQIPKHKLYTFIQLYPNLLLNTSFTCSFAAWCI